MDIFLLFLCVLCLVTCWGCLGLCFEDTYQHFKGDRPNGRQLMFLGLTGGPLWLAFVAFKQNKVQIIDWLNGGK